MKFSKKEKKVRPAKPNTIVLRPRDKGGYSFEHVLNAAGPMWLYNGRFVYLYYANGGNSLESYEPPSEIKMLPDKLFRAFHWDPVKRLLAYKMSLLDKVNMGLGVAVVGILAFIIFLMMDTG